MTGGELDVEVRHERLHVVVAQTLEMKRRRELHVGQLHRVDVHLLHAWRGDNRTQCEFMGIKKNVLRKDNELMIPQAKFIFLHVHVYNIAYFFLVPPTCTKLSSIKLPSQYVLCPRIETISMKQSHFKHNMRL